MSSIVTKTYLGLKFSIFELNALIEKIKNTINNNEQLVIFGYSLTVIPKFKNHPEFFTYSNKFDVFLADGRGMYLLLKTLGFKIRSDISIPRLSEKLMQLANDNNYKVLLFGAKEEINKKAVEKSKRLYPNAIICDGINGYYNKEDEQKIVAKINSENPDILLIGISSPIKEKFVNDWRAVLSPKIIVPCGGVIDAFAGETKITPPLLKKLGLAWLYRYVQEPIRLFKPILINGLSIIFILFPTIIFNFYIRKNKNFSIPKFYGIKSE